MDNLIKNIKRSMWLRALIFIVAGLFIAFKPALLLDWSVKLLALYLVIAGIIGLINGFRENRPNSSINATMTVGIVQIIAAIFVWFFAKGLLLFLPFILGIALLIHGINYLLQIRSHRQYVNSNLVPSYIYSVLIIIAAVVMIFNPFGSLTILFSIFGWLLVVMGIAEIAGTRIFK